MALLDSLLTGGVGSLVKEIVGSFKLSPEAKLEFDKQLEEHKFALAKMDADLEAKLADTASANIQAEAKGNWYTASARPTFLYIMEFILLWNYVIVPLLKEKPIDLPEPLFWLFGSCMLGYTAARTWEKLY